MSKLEDTFKKEMDLIHQAIGDLEDRDKQMVEQITQLNSITSPSSITGQPSSSTSTNSDPSASLLNFLNSLGDGFISRCTSSNSDPSAIQMMAQEFTSLCAQMGHNGVSLK
eukprot:10289614-Karenia_brevis.AAC.1